MTGEILAAFDCDPTEAASGAEALMLLAALPFDVALMDINMPGMTGVEVVRRLRAAAGPERDTPVIAVTSEVSRCRQDYLDLGFNGFVAKPFATRDQIAAVRSCAANASGSPGTTAAVFA